MTIHEIGEELSFHRDSLKFDEEELTDEKLAFEWTLSADDKTEIFKCRGQDNQKSFTLLLCVLRNHGFFLKDGSKVPNRALNHINRQLGFSPIFLFEIQIRDATRTEYERRICHYLGYRRFDSEVSKSLQKWLEDKISTNTSDLEQRCKSVLQSWKVVLPGNSTLARLISEGKARHEKSIFEGFSHRIPQSVRDESDMILQVPDASSVSELRTLKQYPPEGTAKNICLYLERHFRLKDLQLDKIDLTGLSMGNLHHFAELGKRYDVSALKRFDDDKRYAIVTCLLVETAKTALDHIVDMNEQYLTKMKRRSKIAYEKKHRALRKRHKNGVSAMLKMSDAVLEFETKPQLEIENIFKIIKPKDIRSAQEACKEFEDLEEAGLVKEFQARYSDFRQYAPRFFALEIQVETGSEKILEAVKLVRNLDAGKIKALPHDAPTQFVPKAWRKSLRNSDGSLKRSVWEIALVYAVRDGLKSRSLYLPDSRKYASFWNLIYKSEQWEVEKDNVYITMEIPSRFDDVLGTLTEEFDAVARATEKGLPTNSFAKIIDGGLRVKRLEALAQLPEIKRLKYTLESSLPRIRIERLLMEVDRWCQFSKKFHPLDHHSTQFAPNNPALLAAIIAHGTNLGISAMGESAEGITTDILQYLSRWYLRESTLKASNAALVNFHMGIPISAVWGDGTVSSSDGQRFKVRQSSLIANVYPRYFGYYDRAVTVYTHVSDMMSVYSTQIISCAERESLHVLDGLIANDTLLQPEQHHTDTHGFTEHIFSLCYLLGVAFMPRIKNLKKQRLYKIDKTKQYGALEPLFYGAVDLEIIREQWDQMVRVAASIKNRLAPAHVIVKRLANSSDRLAKAFTMLGRVLKTAFILRYIHEEDLPRMTLRQLNFGEFRQSLAQHLFFADQGDFRTGDFEQIMNKASCLSLLSNAALVWNTVKISEIITGLRENGVIINNDTLSHVSPLPSAHIIPTGTYNFTA